MRLLLDTHIFLWVVNESPRLKSSVRRTIEEADQVFVSAASIWEAAIKIRLGKLKGDSHALAALIVASGFTELPVSVAHAAAIADLPLHHHDPFDRLLVAQAQCEPLRLLTADSALAQYGPLVDVV